MGGGDGQGDQTTKTGAQRDANGLLNKLVRGYGGKPPGVLPGNTQERKTPGHMQEAEKGGNWVDAQVDPRTNIDIENAILTRARQLRIAGGS